MDFTTRFYSCLPLWLNKLVVENSCNTRFCHKNFGLHPSHCVTGQHPMVNDALPYQIITGTLVIKPNIGQFTGNGVEFDDGTAVKDLDVVIFCTGYDMRFPYLEIEKEILNKNEVNLYKYVFPPFLKKSSLAIIGNVQPLGAVNPLSELQARWACGVFVGNLKLLTKKAMEGDVSLKRETMKKRYYSTKRHTVQVILFYLKSLLDPF